MRDAAAGLVGPLWFLWGGVQWAFALSLLVFMRGFFPDSFETLLGLRLPWAVAGVAASYAAGGLPNAALAAAAAAAALWLSPAGGGGGAAAVAACGAAWVPFLAAAGPSAPARPRDAGSELAAAVAAALWATAAWGLAARPGPGALAALAALLLALALAAGAAARLGPRPLRLGLAAAAAAWAVFRLLLAPLGLAGWTAAAVAVPVGAAVAAAFSGLSAALGAAASRAPSPWRTRGAGLAALLVATLTAALGLAFESRADWSHAVQGLTLLAGWTAAWLLWREAVPATGLGEGRAAAAAAALLALAAAGPSTPPRARSEDPALRALSRLADHPSPHDAYFAGLSSRMGRPDRVPPPWDNPLPPPAVARSAKPDIVLLVLDSLRPDRLGLPGAAPALAALAKDSAVFERAFTPYGGTHLAVPALWSAGPVPHGPLPSPFLPVNALERLLAEEGYRKLMAPDIHVQSVTSPPPAWETFDEGHSILRKACPALEDLGRRLGRRRAGEAPVFAYAQLFDMHIAARDAAPGDESARTDGGASYARALARTDACLGAFLARLKALGRYEETLLVVTADHGDSLGEEGRWGHAHTAFPEVLRIPLILKLPRSRPAGLAPDITRTALLTDVVPTLARLLGRGPWPARPGAGRSLLRGPGEGEPEDGAGFLVASSYAPVFGRLSPDGGRLFLADAVDKAFHLFALPATGPAERRELSPDELELEKRALSSLLERSAPR